MSHVVWSQLQKDHRQHMKEAFFIYTSAAVADPGTPSNLPQMTLENCKNSKLPFDMAVSDYCHTGNDLLRKKHMDDQEKPKTGTRTLFLIIH